MTRKLLVKDAKGERELLLVGTILVGRDPSCDISANDSMLSRQHAEFKVASHGVVIRDLKSRNGISVNGVRTQEATLFPGDVVEIAGFTIRYVDGDTPAVPASAPESDDDETVMLGRKTPVAGAAAPPPPPDDDGTIVVARSGRTPAHPAEPSAEDGGTILMPGSPGRGGRPAAAPSAGAAPADAAVVPAAGQPARTTAAAVPPPPAAKVKAKRAAAPANWSVRVFISIMALAILIFTLAVVPANIARSNILDGTADQRAGALVHWLAADAAAALQTGRSVTESADAVSRQSGVVSALVIGPDGRVRAPAARNTEVIQRIPGIDVPPADVRRLMSAPNGEFLEYARPVRTADGTQAVAWVTFRPTVPPAAESTALTWFPALVVALAGALLVASQVRRSTNRALAGINEQAELAISGQTNLVSDPLGLPGSKQLTEAVNYLIERIKSQGSEAPSPAAAPAAAPGVGPHAAGAAHGAHPVTSSPSGQGAAPAPGGPEGRLVANDKFRITEATPGCAQLVGGDETRFIGEHLIDAIPDQQVVDAVLKCLGAVAAGGTERATVTTQAGARMEVVVARAGKDRPVTVIFKAFSAGAA